MCVICDCVCVCGSILPLIASKRLLTHSHATSFWDSGWNKSMKDTSSCSVLITPVSVTTSTATTNTSSVITAAYTNIFNYHHSTIITSCTYIYLTVTTTLSIVNQSRALTLLQLLLVLFYHSHSFSSSSSFYCYLLLSLACLLLLLLPPLLLLLLLLPILPLFVLLLILVLLLLLLFLPPLLWVFNTLNYSKLFNRLLYPSIPLQYPVSDYHTHTKTHTHSHLHLQLLHDEMNELYVMKTMFCERDGMFVFFN